MVLGRSKSRYSKHIEASERNYEEERMRERTAHVSNTFSLSARTHECRPWSVNIDEILRCKRGQSGLQICLDVVRRDRGRERNRQVENG